MPSTGAEGSASLELTFDATVDPDMGQVQARNKLRLVTSQLPTSAQTQGISVTRSTSSILMVGALVGNDGSGTSLGLGDVISRTIQNPIQRTEGLGSARMHCSEYAMRIWLDPYKLAQYGLTADDVTSAVSAQNTNVAVGTLGDLPRTQGSQIAVSLSARSQLSSAGEFERILLKTESDGASVFLGDVAEIEIAAADPGASSRFNGKPAAGFAVRLAPGAARRGGRGDQRARGDQDAEDGPARRGRGGLSLCPPSSSSRSNRSGARRPRRRRWSSW